MAEEKKELKKNLKNEELCEGKQKLSIDELERVNGGGSNPLYVVDGAPVASGLEYLNPSDIESIQVLKDASACAPYGVIAAN